MRAQLLTYTGAAFIGVAIWLAFRSHNRHVLTDTEALGGSPAVAREAESTQNRQHLRSSPAHTPRIRRVELDPNDCTELEWSVDELDAFLEIKSSQITSKQMASLLVYLLPSPIGTKASPCRLKAGSIQLRDQVRLCIKYLDTKDQQSLFSLFLTRWCSTNASLEEFRRDAVEQMPPGAVRAGNMSGYFCHRYTNLSDIREMLASDELPKLRGNGDPSRLDYQSDYSGAVNGIESSLNKLLEKGDAKTNEIVTALKASNLDEYNKGNIIRQIEKRGAEVEAFFRNHENPKSKRQSP